MKRFTNKTRNKVWAKVDRYFTWDMKSSSSFFCHHDDGTRTHVYIGLPSMYGWYLSIDKVDADKNKISEYKVFAQTMHEVNDFIKVVKLVG